MNSQDQKSVERVVMHHCTRILSVKKYPSPDLPAPAGPHAGSGQGGGDQGTLAKK